MGNGLYICKLTATALRECPALASRGQRIQRVYAINDIGIGAVVGGECVDGQAGLRTCIEIGGQIGATETVNGLFGVAD